MVKRKSHWALTMVMILLPVTNGCAWFGTPPEAELLQENRKHLVESIRPALVDALHKAKGPDGEPIYIDAYRTEKVNLLDEIIRQSARVAPTDEDQGQYTPEPLPWKRDGEEDE